jgi:hypothetical protein
VREKKIEREKERLGVEEGGKKGSRNKSKEPARAVFLS